jgi:N-acetylmuramoyl-L-alanine amidase
MNRRHALSLLLGSMALLWRGEAQAKTKPTAKPKTGAASRGPWPPVPEAKPKPALPRAVVVLDPGHGGRDPGAIGAGGTQEKEVTLAICREIQSVLSRTSGQTVVLTRSGDRFISLPDRIEIAHHARADLFVSIHADAAPNRAARGVSAYTLAEKASDELSAHLAVQENKVDLIYGVDLSHADKQTTAILIDLARRHSHNSALVAQRKLIDQVGTKLRLLENPMRSANFAVLKSPQIPSLLIETGFLSNRHDEKMLSSARGRNSIAQAIGAAISAIAREIKDA